MAQDNLNILVLLRETKDPRPPATTTSRGAGISERGLRFIANPADLSALEQALQLKDRLGASVTTLAIGPKRLDDLLRLSASLGADRCIRCWDHGLDGGDAVADARILARIIKILSPLLIVTGSRALDQGDDPVPALAAAMRFLPCLTAVTDLALKPDTVEVLRKSDRGGRQKVAAPYPCMVLFEEGAVPRYPSVDAVTTAVNAPVDVWTLATLGLPFREVGATGSCLHLAEYGTPRPDPVRVATPDANLPTFERILSLLSGGIKAREGRQHQLGAEETAAGIWRIFAEEGLVRKA
jgi:electron transfer flavoprotein beta subunit